MSGARPFALGVALLVLTGCISLPGGSAKDQGPVYTYTLHPPGGAAKTSPVARDAPMVVVAKPELPPALATDRIALFLDQGRRSDYYADVHWSGRLEDLLQDFIIAAARRGLPGDVVATPEVGAPAQHRLAVKVSAFQPVYEEAADKPPRLDVALTMTVVALPAGAPESQVTVSRTAPASANTVTAITQGLERLLQDALDEAFKKTAPALTAH